jgi:hypothetical protein
MFHAMAYLRAHADTGMRKTGSALLAIPGRLPNDLGKSWLHGSNGSNAPLPQSNLSSSFATTMDDRPWGRSHERFHFPVSHFHV